MKKIKSLSDIKDKECAFVKINRKDIPSNKPKPCGYKIVHMLPRSPLVIHNK